MGKKYYLAFGGVILFFLWKNKKLSRKIKKYSVNKKIEKYVKITRTSKDNYEVAAAYYMIGNLYCYELGDYKSALDFYKRVVDDKNVNYLEDSALYNIGKCYLFMGEKNKAKNVFKKITVKYKNSARAKDAELELSKL